MDCVIHWSGKKGCAKPVFFDTVGTFGRSIRIGWKYRILNARLRDSTHNAIICFEMQIRSPLPIIFFRHPRKNKIPHLTEIFTGELPIISRLTCRKCQFLRFLNRQINPSITVNKYVVRRWRFCNQSNSFEACNPGPLQGYCYLILPITHHWKDWFTLCNGTLFRLDSSSAWSRFVTCISHLDSWQC